MGAAGCLGTRCLISACSRLIDAHETWNNIKPYVILGGLLVDREMLPSPFKKEQHLPSCRCTALQSTAASTPMAAQLKMKRSSFVETGWMHRTKIIPPHGRELFSTMKASITRSVLQRSKMLTRPSCSTILPVTDNRNCALKQTIIEQCIRCRYPGSILFLQCRELSHHQLRQELGAGERWPIQFQSPHCCAYSILSFNIKTGAEP